MPGKVIGASAGLAAVFIGALTMLGIANTIELVNGITIAASITLLGVYAPLWWPALKGHLDGAGRLGVGIGLLAISLLVSRSWAAFWRLSEYPDWMRSHWLVALGPFIGIIGAGFLITVPSNADESVRKRGWLLLVTSLVVGAGVAGFVIGSQWAFEAGPVVQQ